MSTATWSPNDYCLAVSDDSPDESVATTVYERVCRTDFSAPGFCLVSLGPSATSTGLRHFMVALKRAMHLIHQSRQGRELVFMSAARFDQQVTTRLHRDGGPDESFLMLGYEPSPVSAEVCLADYSRCAHELGITPDEFLKQHNPMFGPGEELLRPFSTRVACFSNLNSQVLLINNSQAPHSPGATWQGVLHTATIHNPCDEHRRVVNSTMVASMPLGSPEPISLAQQHEFIHTSVVRRSGYDKPHLADDY